MLSQPQRGSDGQLREKVIAYASRKMTRAEGHYSSFKGELSALLGMIKKFRYFLQWKEFVVRTDHKPLVKIHSFDPPTLFESRLLHGLSTYDFEVLYRQGKKRTDS